MWRVVSASLHKDVQLYICVGLGSLVVFCDCLFCNAQCSGTSIIRHSVGNSIVSD